MFNVGNVFYLKEKQMKTLSSLVVLIGVPAFMAIVALIVFAIGALLWPYSINTWLIYSGRDPALEWWMGGLMGFVPGIGQSCIPIAFITFILMLFLG